MQCTKCTFGQEVSLYMTRDASRATKQTFLLWKISINIKLWQINLKKTQHFLGFHVPEVSRTAYSVLHNHYHLHLLLCRLRGSRSDTMLFNNLRPILSCRFLPVQPPRQGLISLHCYSWDWQAECCPLFSWDELYEACQQLLNVKGNQWLSGYLPSFIWAFKSIPEKRWSVSTWKRLPMHLWNPVI